MTLEEFREFRTLEGRRVRMTFADGQEVIATLFDVATDLDESQHLIYENVEWSALPHIDVGTGAFYAPGEDLVSCVPLEAIHA